MMASSFISAVNVVSSISPSSSSRSPLISSPLTSSLSQNPPSSSRRRPISSLTLKPSPNHLICRAAAEYVFPDPIPEFAEAETERFRTHLFEKLAKKKKDLFGDSIEEVVRVCAEILNNFLHTEYGGPGTLLVIPFIDMADVLNERGLPGGPQAARAAVVWAQKHVDKDWQEWTRREEGKQRAKQE